MRTDAPTIPRRMVEDITTAVTDICGPDTPEMVLCTSTSLTPSGFPTIGWTGPIGALVPLGIAMAEVLGAYEAGEMIEDCTVETPGPGGDVTIMFPGWGSEE